ncbi:MAG: JAB domain-containing protein, partial [Lachnospiraceae bacterium]|nr:JAB domain-containing protein [Lachnospiraceae bacterium]
PQLSSPQAIAAYYMEDMRHKNQEELILLMLNGRNRRIGELIISRGTVSGSMITPREIFVEALRHHAVSIVLLHNHPSGDPTPSEEDHILTVRVWETGELIGVPLLDHIIIGDCCYISFHERGIYPYEREE